MKNSVGRAAERHQDGDGIFKCLLGQDIAGSNSLCNQINDCSTCLFSSSAAEEIAKAKMPDLTAADMDAAVRTIAGSARSMGITVEGL